MSGTWQVLEAGGLVTVQDAGRAGYAHLGVPRAGWLDPAAARLGNRLVGNDADAASLEVTALGIRLRAGRGAWVAVTGAACEVEVDGVPRPHGAAVWVADGAEVRLGAATEGVRSYLAVAGGLDVPPVLGSRSTDTLARIGPPRVEAGAELPVGTCVGAPAAVDVVARTASGPLRLDPGPHADRFRGDVLGQLSESAWGVAPESDRIGMRLSGHPLERATSEELPSAGLVLGAVQVPPSGLPLVFLADHPTTGGYPVAAVVHPDDVGRCAQMRPGDPVRFTRA